jgi:hypothetical protein
MALKNKLQAAVKSISEARNSILESCSNKSLPKDKEQIRDLLKYEERLDKLQMELDTFSQVHGEL